MKYTTGTVQSLKDTRNCTVAALNGYKNRPNKCAEVCSGCREPGNNNQGEGPGHSVSPVSLFCHKVRGYNSPNLTKIAPQTYDNSWVAAVVNRERVEVLLNVGMSMLCASESWLAS